MATTADSCPNCGARNTWLHPEIERFRKGFEQIKDRPECKVHWDRVSMWGQADVERGVSRLTVFSLSCLVLGLFQVVLVGGYWSLLGGVLLFVGFVTLLVRVLFPPKKLPTFVTFRVDFSTSPPEWTSNDEEYWRPIKDYIFQHD